MKKLILTTLILFAGFLFTNLHSQILVPVTIKGQVTDIVTGDPIPNHTVFVTSDSSSSFFSYFNAVTTDNLGHYLDVVQVPANMQILFNIFTIDCFGNFHNAYGVSTNSPVINNFSICGMSTTQCFADFHVFPDSLTPFAYYFVDMSFPLPDSWLWDFGDGTTGNLPNLYHVYNSPGVYNVCLTITKGIPGTSNFCQDTHCKIIVVDTIPGQCHNHFQFFINNLSVDFFGFANPPNSAFAWDFGDGNSGTGPNVTHTYAAPGIYPVTLTTAAPNGCTFTSFKNVHVTGQNACNPMFNAMPVPNNNMTFQFIDMSMGNPVSWSWVFGDGTVSTLQDPIHTYNAPGIYAVCLTIVCNPNGIAISYCDSIIVSGNQGNCQAMFLHHPDSLNQLGFHFIDISIPLPDTWLWDFGDGTTGNVPNSYHVYNSPGVYNVCLTITKGIPGTSNFCQDTHCKIIVVDTIPGQCHNHFQFFINNLSVDFFGFANPPNSAFAWDFGDGNSGTGPNVTHTYVAPGIYPVTLTTAAPNGCTFTSFKNVHVTGGNNCKPKFLMIPDSINNMTFHFIDQSNGQPTLWYWDFGDGAHSIQQNTTHTYNAPGIYNVCLTITCDPALPPVTHCKTLYVNSNPPGAKIHGKITMGYGFADHAKVYLIVFDSVTNTLTAADTVMIQNNMGIPSYYEFVNIQPGTYLVKAALMPGSVSYNDFMPTYYINTLWWDYANDIVVNNQWVKADINLIAGQNPGGPGFIGGNVTQGANKLLGPGDAIPDVEIMLLSMNNEPHLYTYSDANGDYGFGNLAYGTYKVWAEVLGKTTVPAIVTIDANNPSITDIDLIVTSTGVTTSIDDNISEIIESVSDVYPNPVNEGLNLEVSFKLPSVLQIDIFNHVGQLIYSNVYNESAGEHLIRINTSNLDGGVYTMRITAEDNVHIMRKFVKIN